MGHCYFAVWFVFWVHRWPPVVGGVMFSCCRPYEHEFPQIRPKRSLGLIRLLWPHNSQPKAQRCLQGFSSSLIQTDQRGLGLMNSSGLLDEMCSDHTRESLQSSYKWRLQGQRGGDLTQHVRCLLNTISQVFKLHWVKVHTDFTSLDITARTDWSWWFYFIFNLTLALSLTLFTNRPLSIFISSFVKDVFRKRVIRSITLFLHPLSCLFEWWSRTSWNILFGSNDGSSELTLFIKCTRVVSDMLPAQIEKPPTLFTGGEINFSCPAAITADGAPSQIQHVGRPNVFLANNNPNNSCFRQPDAEQPICYRLAAHQNVSETQDDTGQTRSVCLLLSFTH